MKIHFETPQPAEMLSKAQEKAQELQDDLRDTAQRLARVTTEYVEANPWKTIGLVALCALALGFLLRPRESRYNQ